MNTLTLPSMMSEEQLLKAVIEEARWRKWKVHHCRPARTQSGRWATPIQGHAGFPDLVLARDNRILFVELKSARGGLSSAQREWAHHLPLQVWRPADWTTGRISRELA